MYRTKSVGACDDQFCLQAKAAESEKEESSNQAAALTLQLQNLISTRDRTQQALKVRIKLYMGEHTQEFNKHA